MRVYRDLGIPCMEQGYSSKGVRWSRQDAPGVTTGAFGVRIRKGLSVSRNALPVLQTNLRSLTLVPPAAISAPFPFTPFSMGPRGRDPLQVFKSRLIGSQLPQRPTPSPGRLKDAGAWGKNRITELLTGTAGGWGKTPERVNTSVLVREGACDLIPMLTLFHASSGNPENQAHLSNAQDWPWEESVLCDR